MNFKLKMTNIIISITTNKLVRDHDIIRNKYFIIFMNYRKKQVE